ncbi:hypothetical protein LSH36_128g01007 [Paralvinella palmiformis]|uniref:Annelid erythrocruorin linker subunit C-terminal domain-containing protein n=1 Tax=Paralvinella palmiformis TaxID=53620 RepID=A0AAD9JX40_9ANNE|nr:hypothetical protein LSH36_128g01007 [Paralvinella palmiformis]
MRGALIFLCLTLWATAEARPQTADDAHFEGQKARLESLKQKLSDLKHELDERLKRVHMVDDEMDLMEQAIIQAESTGCKDNMEFQCGGHHPKCISRLLVTATIDFDPHAPNYDPATSLHVQGHMDLMVGDNRLYFSSHEKSGLAFECTFDGIDDHHCHGRVIHESSQLPCAYFTLHRVGKFGSTVLLHSAMGKTPMVRTMNTRRGSPYTRSLPTTTRPRHQ